MTPNSKEFKELQELWYKKLKKKGFKDIESKSGLLDVDKALNNVATHYTQATFTIKEDYYRLAGQFFHDHAFDTKFDRYIWENHSNGVSIRNIVKILRAMGYRTYKREVHERLQFLVKEMKTYATKK